ncbi:MAG: hypothetical protein EBU08_11315 [Micrococcales bacterium]|jgi:hypothetical protein|nr:hypothetical protein [Micrococcales bacterium]
MSSGDKKAFDIRGFSPSGDPFHFKVEFMRKDDLHSTLNDFCTNNPCECFEDNSLLTFLAIAALMTRSRVRFHQDRDIKVSVSLNGKEPTWSLIVAEDVKVIMANLLKDERVVNFSSYKPKS